MFFHVQKLINEIVPDEPDPAAANALQEGLGGQFSEMRMARALAGPNMHHFIVETMDDPPAGFLIEDLPERPEEFALSHFTCREMKWLN